MLFNATSLVIAGADGGDATSSKPTASISSMYSYVNPKDALDYRAIPDDSGVFYFDIKLDKAPKDKGDVLVYYRTVDDSAVAIWGDYESVGIYGDAYVILNSSNNYSARVMVQSTILDDAFYGPTNNQSHDDNKFTDATGKIYSRRFYFELIKVEGDAVLDTSTSSDDRNESKLICYLKGNRYHYQYTSGASSIYPHKEYGHYLNTPWLINSTSYSQNLNIQFSDEWRNYLATGNYSLGFSLYGDCLENYWNSDEYAIFELYYTYKGQTKKAMELNIQGEFDDSTFFGWERIFEYINCTDAPNDLEDFMSDNFEWLTIYDNDENVVAHFDMPYERTWLNIEALCNKFKDAKFGGTFIEGENPTSYSSKYDVDTLHYIKLPSNFLYADSYSYIFRSFANKDKHQRRLENITLSFTLLEEGTPKIQKLPNESQMVVTNINEIMDGDKLKLAVRFDRPVYANTKDCYITADINGQHNIRLNLSNDMALDTLVFEGELPDNAKGIKINSLRNIKINGSIKSYMTNKELIGKTINDIYGYTSDLRVPYASVVGEDTGTGGWIKSKALDLYLYAEGTASRFNDYTTVYYQWSNSKELPKTYDSKVTFHTSMDNEIVKSIRGTGNGETYLHVKSVSRSGATSTSDKLTTVYDSNNPSAVYTPFGPFYFDNEPPKFSADDITLSGSMKDRILSFTLPNDEGGSGLQYMNLYYVDNNSESGEGILLKKFTADNFSGTPPTTTHTISHKDVGVGIDENGNVILDRKEIEFYWILADKLGNTSKETARFKIAFDTNDYLDSEISASGPKNITTNSSYKTFENTTEKIDDVTYIYNYKLNKDKPYYISSSKNVCYGFHFVINHSMFGETDKGIYDVNVYFKGEKITDYTFQDDSTNGFYAIWFYGESSGGRYDIQLTRTEGDSVRVSRTYSIYTTDGEDDATATKEKIVAGTLLSNSVYQLSSEYNYFYYKDAEGNRQQEYYNGEKLPATFSSYQKAKEYVYYKELSDIYLIELTSAIANALDSGTTGYLMAKGESTTPKAGQYWIRYKSESWTPTSGDSAWVYYYYGMDGTLSEGALSINLQNALNTVAGRIANYGKNVILTDMSLFLGSTSGEKMLDNYGMPYLNEGQIHNVEEISDATKCGNVWSIQTYYSADKNIYKSYTYIGEEGTDAYDEYPIIGNVALPNDSRFQYMTYADYTNKGDWKELKIPEGQSFINVLTTSGLYYIREMSRDGVAIYPIYVDKEAPKVSFSKIDEGGNRVDIPVDGVEVLDIRTKDLIIGSISRTEYDRLSYVAVYKINQTLVGIYTADDLESSPVKLADGNYYIVVADRSGNHYTITAKVSSSDLECEIKESPDKFIKLTCNRKSDQIVIYEVHLNGELITSTYMPEQSFEKAGLYTVYIQDIYGNIFSKEHLFTRNYPTVTWKYLGTDGKYHEYNSESGDTNGFIMSWVSDNRYKISTSVKTRFSFSGNYDFEFLDAEPEYNKTIGTETVVTITEGQSFTLKVFYKNHKDCYTIYSGIVDVTAPTVNVFAEIDVLRNGEYDSFQRWLANGKVGDVIKLDELYFSATDKSTRTVTNGDTISADIIKINVSDANELSLVEVYLDGSLVKKQDVTSGFSQIVVSRWGNYRIVAKDTLGNVSEFSFTNGMPNDLSYFVDGAEKELDLHSYLNFKTIDDKNTYTKVDYANTEIKLEVKKNCDVFISVEISGEKAEIYGFRISDGRIYPLTYQIILDKDGKKEIELNIGDAIIDINFPDFKLNNEYMLFENVYATINANKIVTIKAYAPKDTSKIATVNARFEFDENNTKFVSAKISQKRSTIYFKDSNGNAIGSPLSTDIRANSGFMIDNALFNSEYVTSIKLYYSTLNDLDVNSLSGKSDIYLADKVYADEGFYLLIVKNLFGNEAIYRIGISKSFGITSSVTFADGQKIYYSKEYNDKLYSNNEITFDILDEDVKYVVTLSGVPYNGFAEKKIDGITYLVFSQAGAYEIRLTDSYGNTIIRQLEINKTAYSVADNLLTGFNEKALKRNEGYTNQKLSIDKSVYDSNGIYYLAIKYGDKINVIFDAFSENSINSTDKALIDVIGNDGDGIYTVICRSRYGAVVSKDIHYRSTPTLKLQRTTRSKSEPETYDLSYALSLGFWSNNTLIFSTDASTYTFTVNGSNTECPRTLAFNNAGDFGSSEYEITYIDEYGFEYTFKAYLVRKTVTAELPKEIEGFEIDGVFNTKNDISITFDKNIYATYTRNNGEETVYHAGDVLKKDGTYRFTVTDYAGNASTLIVKKDTIVDFAFIQTSTMTPIQSGAVVNSSKVSLDILNKDSAFIEKVLKNGVIQKDFTATKFTEDGKWEIILSDKLGNKAYFYFYILTRSQNGFSYTTPYEYHITEMWYDSGDGVKISYLNFVNHGDFTSSFDFIENGKYTVLMTSDVTGNTSMFEFTINTLAPNVSLVGCTVDETTINDVSITGCNIGDIIMVFKETDTGEELIEKIEVTSLSTKMPTVSEGGKYRIVVESEAGVPTELTFVRKHVMNTAGSVFIMIIIGISVIGLFAGLIYRNKSKTDA